MNTTLTVAPDVSAATTRSWSAVARACLELAKARLSSLVLLTTAIGFVLAGGAFDTLLFLWTVLGTALGAFGANALNQVMELPNDRLMERTRDRPLPSGRLSPAEGLACALLYLTAGVGILALQVNLLTAGLVLFVAVSYAAVYTPLKQRSAWCTLVGAVCGALPPVVGWTAVTGEVQLGAGMLFGVLFLWQIPHFLAIDWVYRRDYSAGGFRMVSSYDPSGALSGRLSVVYSAALIPISLLAVPAGLAGPLYAIGAMVLGLGYWGFSVKFLLQRTRPAARQLFFMSLAYLPLLLTILAGDPSA